MLEVWILDFFDFISPFTSQFLFRLRRYIKHSRAFHSISKHLEFHQKYSAMSGTLFSVFGNRNQVTCT